MEFTVTINNKECKAELREPLFNDYRMASMAANFNGVYDRLGAGSSLIQHCWVSGDESLKKGDESKDPEIAKAYTALALDVYNEIYTELDIEIKKK